MGRKIKEQEEIAEVFAARINLPETPSIGSWNFRLGVPPRLVGELLPVDCELINSIDAAGQILFVKATFEAAAEPSRKALPYNKRSYTATPGPI
ncbi:hypothetical protein [uncultured Agrobacterium sp.]|uniref:hypothetical protein n=1 Tax=uncultured Agrobacterium sp. TaxID=157277 RepID=UPI0025D90D1C|nr:hypothetical protein [uncultured Agrobacterium sp.]